MIRARSLAGFVAGVALIVAGCDDPTGFEATAPVATDTLSIFAISGTPPSYPSALDLLNVRPTRVEAGMQFDVAFDIDEEGNAVIYPASLVSTAAPYRVGVRDTAIAFVDLARAPGGTYPFDEPVVLEPGEVAIVETQTPICQYALSPFFYSKIVVDSIDVDLRQLYLRVTIDPNCGFRSFLEGIPRN